MVVAIIMIVRRNCDGVAVARPAGYTENGEREGDREGERGPRMSFHAGRGFRKDVGRRISKLLRGNFGRGLFEIAVPQERKEGRKRARSK